MTSPNLTKQEWIPMYQLNADSRYTHVKRKPKAQTRPLLRQSTAVAMSGGWGYAIGVAWHEAQREKERQALLNN